MNRNKAVMISEKHRCSGCSACYSICPVNAICMKEDLEGFLYPVVDSSSCVGCGKCKCVCPYFSGIPEPDIDLEICYAAYNKNSDERESSSSGGIFVLLAKQIIAQGGIVFGAAFDANYQVYHTSAESEDELMSLLGSKYMQSRIEDCFEKVKKALDKGRSVLFSGTTCQIGGLKKYLSRDYEKLFCIDFICLGVPSPKIWNDYLNTFFPRQKIRSVQFKNKKRGWHNFSLAIEFANWKYNRNGRNTLFFNGYFRNLYSRPSCSYCVYKKVDKRVSDITISDCWGFFKIAPELDDNRGLSSIICHSKKGKTLFESITKDLVFKEARIEDVKTYNSNYNKSPVYTKERVQFWKDYGCFPKWFTLLKWCMPSFKQQFKYVKEELKGFLKNR